MSDDVLKIDFGDGVSALDRTMRAITMVADGAIMRLVNLGWKRRSIGMKVMQEDPLPCWVTLKGENVFEIGLRKQDDGTILIQGSWLEGHPLSPKTLDKILGR